MDIVKIILTIIQLISGLGLIVIIMLQSGKGSGISGAIGGGSDSYSFKAKAKTMDAKLSKMTKWVAIAFVLLTFVLNIL